jgi:hypothetical protein
MKQELETTEVHNDALSRQSLGLAAIMLGLAIIVVFGDLMIAGNSKLVSKGGVASSTSASCRMGIFRSGVPSYFAVTHPSVECNRGWSIR